MELPPRRDVVVLSLLLAVRRRADALAIAGARVRNEPAVADPAWTRPKHPAVWPSGRQSRRRRARRAVVTRYSEPPLVKYSTLCITAADMLEDLQASHADGTFKRALRRYAKPQVLLLDEFGHTGSFDQKATNHLYRLVAARYRQASIVLTANTGFASWKHLFPSESSAIATVDRLVDQATILRFTGKSFRDPKEIVGAPLED
jgi:hypothetical protein